MGEETAQLVKYVPHKQKDLSLALQDQQEEAGLTVHTCDAVLGRGADRRTLRSDSQPTESN